MARELLEISDVIVDYDVDSLERRPVRQDEVVARLRANGQARAARYVAQLPASDGVLDPATCDQILLRAHTELQRLSEEFLQADRTQLLLKPMLDTLRGAGVTAPYRVVDVGCGLGFLVRALAAHGRLGRDVQLMGCDMNVALVERARALADEEALTCDFRTTNAFKLAEPAHVFLSTGVLHHFRGDGLAKFFSQQRSAYGFIHYDMQQSRLSPLGSWMFHRSRMREPLARHDGVVSAMRAHSMRTLLEAARVSDAFEVADFDGAVGFSGVLARPMHAIVGLRATLWQGFLAALGPQARRLRSA